MIQWIASVNISNILFTLILSFLFMILEILLKKPVDTFFKKHQIDEKQIGLRLFRFIKLFIIVIIGELFFRAQTLAVGWTMFSSIFTNFNLSTFTETLPFLRLDTIDWIIVIVGTIITFLVDIYKEFHGSIRSAIAQKPIWLRWPWIWYCCDDIRRILIVNTLYKGWQFSAILYHYLYFSACVFHIW